MSSAVERVKLTPPELARQWGVTTEKILNFIRSGELAAIDASARRAQRPRYLIDRSAVAAFERARAVVPPSTALPHRRSAPSGVVEFFT